MFYSVATRHSSVASGGRMVRKDAASTHTGLFEQVFNGDLIFRKFMLDGGVLVFENRDQADTFVNHIYGVSEVPKTIERFNVFVSNAVVRRFGEKAAELVRNEVSKLKNAELKILFLKTVYSYLTGSINHRYINNKPVSPEAVVCRDALSLAVRLNRVGKDPVVDAPVVEAPVVEAPVVEAPVVEAPVVEAPVVEAPVVEAPVVEAPVVEAPVVEAPAKETVEEAVEEVTEDAPVEEAPAEETGEEAVEEVTEDAPVEEAPAEETVEEAVEEVTEDAPVEEAPAEETGEEAVEEVTEDAPVEETVDGTSKPVMPPEEMSIAKLKEWCAENLPEDAGINFKHTKKKIREAIAAVIENM